MDLSLCETERNLRLTLTPHPTARTGSASLNIDQFDGESLSRTLMLAPLETGDEPSEGPDPQPTSIPDPDQGETDTPAVPSTDRVTLSDGHVDVRVTRGSKEETLSLTLGDSTGQVDKHEIERDLTSVVLAVPASALAKRTQRMADPSYDFLGPIGSQAYHLTQSQTPGLIWPGFSTEHVAGAYPEQGIDIILRPRTRPDDGDAFFFLSRNLAPGIEELLVDTRTGRDSVISTSVSSHLHGGWAFTQPGTYVFDVQARIPGTQVVSEVKPLTFRVGEADQPTHSEGSTPEQDQPDNGTPQRITSEDQTQAHGQTTAPSGGSSSGTGTASGDQAASSSPTTEEQGSAVGAAASQALARTGMNPLTAAVAVFIAGLGCAALGAGALRRSLTSS